MYSSMSDGIATQLFVARIDNSSKVGIWCERIA